MATEFNLNESDDKIPVEQVIFNLNYLETKENEQNKRIDI